MLYIIRIILLIGLITLLAYQPSYATHPCSENGNNWPATKLDKDGPTYFILATAANGNPDMAKTDQLELANQDAENFAKVMRKYFTPAVVCLLPNVRYDGFKTALRRLAELVRAEDKVFIYFSGHGMTEANDYCKEGGDHTYCKETDCVDEGLVTFSQRAGEVKRVRDKEFVDLVNGIKTDRPVTILLDTCFAGGMVRGEKNAETGFQDAKPKNFVKEGGQAHLPSRKCPMGVNFKSLEKSILYAASQEGQLAWEYKGQGGIFTHIFLQKLEELKTQAKVPLDEKFLDEVFQITKAEVASITKKNLNYYQEPQRWEK
jgi:hypothetical protein